MACYKKIYVNKMCRRYVNMYDFFVSVRARSYMYFFKFQILNHFAAK